ncbi:hypothetical protein DFH07DRAFT_779766 [Mycena maculata]|uniref:Uncharacterized protein n=1 Tax=Mycena maculata TaxID=230809 RepID=A0AAD7I8F2_9AGAR|nr:hypothetical protein DFH07DRAFT_779766 [Mycena maculata]
MSRVRFHQARNSTNSILHGIPSKFILFSSGAPSLQRLVINNLHFLWKWTNLVHEVDNLYVLDILPDAWPDAAIMARFLTSANNISILSFNTSGVWFTGDVNVFTLLSLTTLSIAFCSPSIIHLLAKASAPKLDCVIFSPQGIHCVSELVPRILRTLKSLESLIQTNAIYYRIFPYQFAEHKCLGPLYSQLGDLFLFIGKKWDSGVFTLYHRTEEKCASEI